MDTSAFALAAGALATVNPCGFAMLPAYLAMFVTNGSARSNHTQLTAVTRALIATAAMTTGFLVTFVTAGLILTPLASSLQRWAPVVTVIVGAILAVMGVLMLLGREVAVALPKPGTAFDPAAGVKSTTLYGVVYALASLGCTIGPFLVVTTTTFTADNVPAGIGGYAAYAVGMGLVVGVASVSVALAQQTATRSLRGVLPYAGRAAGALLVLAGAYVTWYGVYELRIFNGADVDDPIINAASAIQSVAADFIDTISPAGFAIALGALVLVAVSSPLWRRRRAASVRRADNPGTTLVPPPERGTVDHRVDPRP